MKILLVWPVYYSLFHAYNPKGIYYNIFSRFVNNRTPLTFNILKALTPKKHTVDFIAGNLQNIDFDKHYDLIGITCITELSPLAYNISDEFRKRGKKVVLGGWHPSALPEEAIQHADSVVIGEAEETWPVLLNDLENNKLKPFYIQKRPVPPSLIPEQENIFSKNKVFSIQATRGCPYGCRYCSMTNMKFRKKFRLRSINDVIKEIQINTGKLFMFEDNSLTIIPKYTKDLFCELKDLNKKFYAYGNLDTLGKDDELLKLASDAGCIGWLIGFESLCQDSLDSVGKRTNKVVDYYKSVKKIHDYGMIVEASFMFGFDYDTKQVFIDTEDFVRKSEIDIPYPVILAPYPGTPMYDKLSKENRILTRDWYRYSGGDVVFQPKLMTPEELYENTMTLELKWHQKLNSTSRMIKGLKYGIYPFFEISRIELQRFFSYTFKSSL